MYLLLQGTFKLKN